nr:hypothetical protein [Tanacetum cinerariifolium]
METKEIELEVANVEKDSEHETLDTKPMPIIIVMPTTKPTLEAEAEIIRSASRPRLTNPTINFKFLSLKVHHIQLQSLMLTIPPLRGSSAHTTTISLIEETPSHTEGEKVDMNIEEKEPKVGNVKKEPEHDTQDTKPIPIIIIRLTTKPTFEAKTKIIRSSSRPQLTDRTIKVQVP